MTGLDVITYWLTEVHKEFGTINLEESIKQATAVCHVLETFSIEDTGIFAYVVGPDMKGRSIIAEVLFYIRPEYRGSIKLFKKYLDEIEKIAIEKKCVSVKIGANMGYKDPHFIKVLQRFGYQVDAVTKDINWQSEQH